MDNLSYKQVQNYCEEHSSGQDGLLLNLERHTHLTELAPQMLAGAHQGLFLEMLSRSVTPSAVLEIGTFTGYTSICLARGIATGGHLDTFEVNPELAPKIKAFLKRSGVDEVVLLHVGDAKELIPGLPHRYDLILVDASKREYSEYFEMCVPKLTQRGLLLFDNTLWNGKIMTGEKDPVTESLRTFNKMLAERDDLRVSMLPIRDGITFVQKR